MDSQEQTPAEGVEKVLKRVILIRLPPGETATTTAATNTTATTATATATTTTTTTTTTTNNQASNTNQNTTTQDNNDQVNPKTESVSLLAKDGEQTTNKKTRTKEEDSNMYKNYSPKQREWMLVYLGYARGLMGMPFEEKLQECIVQQTNSILAKRGRFCNINRIPSSKTLRTVWKNLWKEERTVASIIRKGGRPRIDPTIKREKRNERERKKRAAAREKRELEKGVTS